MGLIIIFLTVLMHLSVYLAGNELAFFPSFIGLLRNVAFVSMFVVAIAWLKKKYSLRASSHVIYIALLLTAIGMAFQYRVSYDIWASSSSARVAIANKRQFIRDKTNILFIKKHPEFVRYYQPPASPNPEVSVGDEVVSMLGTLGKMSLILLAFVLIVVLQLKGKFSFLEGNYLFLGVLTFVFTVILGGITAVFGGAFGGGNFLANMTPWEVLKIPLVLTMTGFVIATQRYFQGTQPVGGDKARFFLVLLLIYFTPLWIFLLIRDFGQLWIMTFFYTFAFFVSTRRLVYPLIGLAALVGAFVLVLLVIPSINGLALAIWLNNWYWAVAAVGAVGIFVGYFAYAAKTRKGTPAKLITMTGGIVGWVFLSFAMPPFVITLFGVGETSVGILTGDFLDLPTGKRAAFLEHARSLTSDLSDVTGLSSEPQELSTQLAEISTDPERRHLLENQLTTWSACKYFGQGPKDSETLVNMLRALPSERLEGILTASPQFSERLARQLGTYTRPPEMVRKINSIADASFVSRLNLTGNWDPSPNLGVLTTPMRRITSWWLMWGILFGDENLQIFDANGPYWRTMEHLFRGFFAMEHGGLLGQGMGLGNPTFVPKAINDFVYVTLSEEMGLVGTTIILLLYTALTWTIILVGQRSSNNYWRLVTINFAILFWAQVFVNVGGVIGFMPLTGIPLPFISRGFFSMLTSFVALGIVVGISHQAELAATAEAQTPEKQ